MSLPGRPKGEFRSAQHEGSPVSHADTAVSFACEGEQLFGVLSRPTDAARLSGVGVVVVVGGPQYRAGSHRQFVQLARALAGQGHVVLRFDVRGMGDSSGAQRGFEHIDADLQAAIDALHAQQPGLRHTVLWGLCDGASAALMYLARRGDGRVSGLCLVNPWLRSAQSLAKTHVKHYYRRRLMEPEFWRKLLSGRVALQALRELLGNLRLSAGGGNRQGGTSAHDADFRTLMARGWHQFEGPVLLLSSSDDYTAQEFLEGASTHAVWQGAFVKAGLSKRDLAQADHTFSTRSERLAMQAAVIDWLQSNCAAA